MTCCILEKRITTTVIPGNPGTPATPGTPARPAYCATSSVDVCEWIPNPAITYRWELVPAYFDGLRWVPAHYESVPYVNGVHLYDLGGIPTVVGSCHTKDVTTCYPAQAAIPGDPGLPPTPSQIITSQNLGWNSHSRAIDPLDVDAILNFTVSAGVRGVFVGVGGAGLDGQPIGVYNHGMLIDASGVWVFELGVKVHQLAASHTSLTALQIERGYDGSITYRADASEYVSATLPGSGTLYPYAYMYSGGDRIMCASYTAGSGTLMRGAFDLPALRVTASESGVNVFYGSMSLPALTCTADGSEIEVISASMSLPALQLVAYEAGANVFFGNMSLPGLTLAASEAGYVPPALTEGYMNLPPLACFGFMTSVELCDGDMTLPALQCQGGEGDYFFGNMNLPAISCYGIEGERLEMWMVDGLIASAPITMARDLVVTYMSTVGMTSVQAFELVMDQSYMSTLEVSSIQTLLAEYSLSMMSELSAQSVQLMAMPTGAALNGLGRVWVVNLDNAATSQYDDYAFNSFFTRDGRHYGVAEDGIYLLEGDDDAGAPIQALAELGLSDFGTSRAKLVPSLYLGVASTGAMVVKVVADGQEYYYTARSSSTDLKNHRVDTGRGLKGVNWSFTVLNQNGGDFDLASIEFVPLETKRRI